ncbi:MAG: HAMP domain-containing sensor histidine kinase [Aggregatilineales bacterium]
MSDLPISADSTRSRWLVLFAHDLRKPLCRLISGLYTLHDMLTTVDNEQLATIMRIISDSGDDLLQMLNAMPINFESAQLPTMCTCSIYTLVERVLNSWQNVTQRPSVTLINNLPGGLPNLCADEGQVLRLLWNLVENAMRYAPNSRVQIVALPQPRFEDGRAFLQIGVLDSGSGIPLELRERIFEYFFRAPETASSATGYGLGLPFCKWMVEQHGGRIWVEDSPEGGAAFWFTLPVCSDQQ